MMRFLQTRLIACIAVCMSVVMLVFRYARHEQSSSAYVFYATQDIYACSALINMARLREKFSTKHQLVALVSDDISDFYLDKFLDLDVTLIFRDPPLLHPDSIPYYQGCLLKLVAFELFHLQPSLEQVVVMDSDQLIIKNIDSILSAPLEKSKVFAPKAYWIDDGTYSSTMMAFRPSSSLWDEVQEAMDLISSNTYDMDIINTVFHDVLTELPAKYGTLNSHWEALNVPTWLLEMGERGKEQHTVDEDLQRLYEEVSVVHFTAVGKPWTYDVSTLATMRPNAHPLLVELWASWRLGAMKLCVSDTVTHL